MKMFARSLTPKNGAGVAALLLFSTVPGAGLLAACDNGTPAPTNPPIPTQQAASGIPRGQAFFQRYCNVCHPGGGQGSGPTLIGLGPRVSDDQIRTLVRNGKNRMPPY